MNALFGPPEFGMLPPATGDGPPRLDWEQALARGKELMIEQGALHGFKADESLVLNYNSGPRTYWYRARTDGIFPEDKSASIYFDADTGKYISSGGTYSGGKNNTVTNWLIALHMVDDPVDYLPYRIFVIMVGIIVAMLSATGIYIWWKKRRARKFSKAHRGVAAAVEEVAAE